MPSHAFVASGLAPRWAAQRPYEDIEIFLVERGACFWGCCAARRGASPLATGAGVLEGLCLAVEGLAVVAGCGPMAWRKRWAMTSHALVASGLAPRWAHRPCEDIEIFLVERGACFWGCCAARRGASPLATGAGVLEGLCLAVEGLAVVAGCGPMAWRKRWAMTSHAFVASGLAPRWAAQRPCKEIEIFLVERGACFWGCCAARRGASPLATGAGVLEGCV
ncbi:hypothetical protein C4J83_5019 [Pseudomonas sp. LBUM920]|nr:hypothetical protein C4J83_5019 [Pseudomonas sp. LBUM920]